jgi:hypothetical protein
MAKPSGDDVCAQPLERQQHRSHPVIQVTFGEKPGDSGINLESPGVPRVSAGFAAVKRDLDLP